MNPAPASWGQLDIPFQVTVPLLLQSKIADALAKESKERWLEQARGVEQKVERPAAEFRRYPELAGEIVQISVNVRHRL